MDPRVKTSGIVLQRQYDLAERAYKGTDNALHAYSQVHALRAGIASLLSRSSGSVTTLLQELDVKAASLEGAGRRGSNRGTPPAGTQLKAFSRLQGEFSAVFGIIEDADLEPTVQAAEALYKIERSAGQTMAAWTGLQQKDLPAVNARLKEAGLETLTVQP
jgi:hypothetical protein